MLRRKVQVLNQQSLANDGLPRHVVDELLDLAVAINTYFGNPKPGTRRGEKSVKFNTVMERLEWFDFGSYAPDEIKGDDLDARP
jgi:hypothetical protein